MRLRLHVFFGVFAVLAAFVLGLVARPAISPFRQRAEIEMTGPHWVAKSGICRVMVAFGDGSELWTTGFVLGEGKILSSRVAVPSPVHPGMAVPWPNSTTNPELPFDKEAWGRQEPVHLMFAFFPGCQIPIHLKVEAFSEVSDTVVYRFDTRQVQAPVLPALSAGSDPERPQTYLELSKTYFVRGDCYQAGRRKLLGVANQEQSLDSAFGRPDEGEFLFNLNLESLGKTHEIRPTFRLNDKFYTEDDEKRFMARFDRSLPVPTGFTEGTPVLNSKGLVVGVIALGGGIRPIGEAVKGMKSVSPRYEFRAVEE